MFMRKITQKCKSVSRLLSPFALALALSACGTTPKTPSKLLYDITAPAHQSSQFYLQNAANSGNNALADWNLLALKALISENQYHEATLMVLRLAKMPLTPIQLSEWQLNRANLLQKTGKPQAALDNLYFDTTWKLPSSQYKRYFLLSANLYQQVNNKLGMLMALALSSPYIVDAEEKQKNSDFIWSILEKMSKAELDTLSASGNQFLSGWLQLAKQLRNYSANPQMQQKALQTWLTKHPSHPANQYLPKKLVSLQAMDIMSLQRIAVLLPLSDKFSAQGKAIRDGIIHQMLDDKTAHRLTLKFYDTNDIPMAQIVNTLEKDKIQFVIGPLQKGKVEEYFSLSHNAFPTLAMNIPQDDELETKQEEDLQSNLSHICYFTLSPEQEAKQAAQHIAQKQHHFPLVIAPENEFGRRVSDAFSKQWQQETGKKAEVALFKNHAAMQKTIQNAFGLQESQARIQKIKQLLGLKMKADQRSRRDIDAVYLIANADELTLLKPFIEVTINPDVSLPQLYGSSRANNRVRGVGELGELRDIEFTDVPLIVDPDTPASQKYHKIWPNQTNSIARLYALGMDAYTLIEALPQMQIAPDYQVNAQSGRLSLGDNCTINRTLSWARFDKKGFVAVK